MLYNMALASAIYQQESATGIICPLPPEPCSHLSPHPTPLDCHRAVD